MYSWASVASIKAVEDPSRAITHIQKTAPAPPAEMAATTPTRLPMPTRQAVETMSACTPERPCSVFWLLDRVTRTISGKRRKGKKRVRTVKYTPAGTRIITSSDSPRVLPPGNGMVTRSPHSRWYRAWNRAIVR